MRLVAWETEAMLRRYDIIDERDIRSGVAKLAAGINFLAAT